MSALYETLFYLTGGAFTLFAVSVILTFVAFGADCKPLAWFAVFLMGLGLTLLVIVEAIGGVGIMLSILTVALGGTLAVGWELFVNQAISWYTAKTSQNKEGK